VGRIEHPLLVEGGLCLNRPKTIARNTILAHKSNERNILPPKKRAGKQGCPGP
jgi:hypothetical protein